MIAQTAIVRFFYTYCVTNISLEIFTGIMEVHKLELPLGKFGIAGHLTDSVNYGWTAPGMQKQVF